MRGNKRSNASDFGAFRSEVVSSIFSEDEPGRTREKPPSYNPYNTLKTGARFGKCQQMVSGARRVETHRVRVPGPKYSGNARSNIPPSFPKHINRRSPSRGLGSHGSLCGLFQLFTSPPSMEGIPPQILAQLITPISDDTTIVLMTCGISGSGKSTLAKSICDLKNTPRRAR